MDLLAPLHYLTYLLTPQRHQRIRDARQKLSEEGSGLGGQHQSQVPSPGRLTHDQRAKAASSESPDHAECARRIENEAKLAAYNGCTEAAAALYSIANQERRRAGLALREWVEQRRRERLSA